MKNDLFEELKINKQADTACNPLDIDVQRIRQKTYKKLNSAYIERKSNIMKSKRKIFAVAAAAAVALGITAFAATGVVSQWFSSSSSIPDYHSLPTAERVVKDIGYEPILINTFENGYSFKNGRIVSNSLADENGNPTEKFKSVSFDYIKDGDTVYFSQDKYSSERKPEGDIISNVNGTDIYYFSYTDKFVPADYKLTEEDKKAEARGELVFSYGSDSVEISKIQSVSWSDGEMHYQLMQMDGKLSANELAAMAEDAIKG